jgi:hypothetical protein
MVRLGQVRKIHDLINTIWTNQKPKAKTQRVSRQGNQTIPYLLTMTTLKIIFYKNIKSILVLVNHHFLIWGGGSIFFHKDIDYEDECYDFQDELFNFEQILRMSRDN